MTHERAKSRTHATSPSYQRTRRQFELRQRRLAKLARKREAPCVPSSPTT